MSSKIVLATGNAHKVAEFNALFSTCGFTVIPQSEFGVGSVAETGTTFVENAIIKARHAAAQTGLPAIADDSGLEVDALQGAPGVYAARYAGQDATDEDNRLKLLHALGETAFEKRRARYWCVLAFMRHAQDPTPLLCLEKWEGYITDKPSMAGGFGYNSIFYVPTHQCTVAELPDAVRNRIGHRGRALQKLLQQMQTTP